MPEKICPLLSKVIQYKDEYNRKGCELYEETCRREDCGFWDEIGRKCGIAAIGDVASATWNIRIPNNN